jgi:tripartite-type tricarboxylate transporter receptor subunit TctC
MGSNSHLCAEDFAQRAGIALVHVPYKSISPLLQDLHGGHVDLAFLPLVVGVLDPLTAGMLRPLGLATSQRDARLPQLPTITQAAGIPAFVHASWGGLVVSAAVPEPAVERLHQALQDTLRNPGFQKELAAGGTLIAHPASLAQAQQALQAEIEKVRPLAAQWLARSAAPPR